MSDDTVALGAGDEQPQRSESFDQKELPGRILQSKRQELNWSVEDVAQSLHLAPRQIVALETDNYGALPGTAISRGFLRSYAKLLKLDPAPLLQMIANETEARSEDVSIRRALPDKPFYADRSLTLGAKPRTWLRSAILLLLALLIGVLVAWKAEWLPSSWMADVKSLLPTQAEPIQESVPQPVDTSREQTQAASMTVVSNARVELSEPTGKNSMDVSATPSTSGAADIREGMPPNSTPAQAPGVVDNTSMLVLKMREDSWIEVRDARNKVLLSRLAKAGESETIPVREPIKLKIGNAAGVDAQLRGVPVELNASAKSNVARLTVN